MIYLSQEISKSIRSYKEKNKNKTKTSERTSVTFKFKMEQVRDHLDFPRVEHPSVLERVREVREKGEFIQQMIELEEEFGSFSVPRRLIEDRLNPLEYFQTPGQFRFTL